MCLTECVCAKFKRDSSEEMAERQKHSNGYERSPRGAANLFPEARLKKNNIEKENMPLFIFLTDTATMSLLLLSFMSERKANKPVG